MVPAQKTENQLIEIKSKIEVDIGDLVEIRMPEDCEPPILAPSVRAAVHEWMIEAQSRRELEAVGLKPRQTCLLEGPPGTGKTTLAHHFAARLGYLLIVAKGEMIMGSHLGESGRNVSRFFSGIKKHHKSVIGFFDEIDALGTARTQDNQACGREMNGVVTALLTNIEGFRGLFFAATNLAGQLGPKLKRSINDPVQLVASVVAQVAPHPSYLQPPYVAPLLWADPEKVENLRGLAWPPIREDARRAVS
jgi:hypothetical protein